jgi:hypothetical protein
MKLLNATNLDGKFGIRGPKEMGEAPSTAFSLHERLRFG